MTAPDFWDLHRRFLAPENRLLLRNVRSQI